MEQAKWSASRGPVADAVIEFIGESLMLFGAILALPGMILQMLGGLLIDRCLGARDITSD